MMSKVVIASLNPVKINAVKVAFGKVFPNLEFDFVGVSVPSGVRDQPMTDIETKQGAINRVENAMSEVANADFWLGLEGGIEMMDDEMVAFAWMCIQKLDSKKSLARTSTFCLPPKVKELVLGGMELGHADDIVFDKSNSKQSNGAVGLLTNDIITRQSYYEEAVIMALIPFSNGELYD